jgi:hypothetical protein
MRLRDHVAVAVRFKNIWIAQVERLCQNNTAIRPVESVLALRETDLAAAELPVHDFEEHIPGAISRNHERVGYESCQSVGYVGAC